MKQNRDWYFQVHEYCKLLAEHYNVPLIKVSAIMSALSPNNTFRSNVLSLEKFLRHDGNCKVTTFGNQKLKAIKILNAPDDITENEVKDILGKGLKTRAFFCNIYQPQVSSSVTVDLWMIRWAKNLGLIPQAGGLTDKRYRIISDKVKELSQEIGVMPHQFQSMVWCQIRGAAF